MRHDSPSGEKLAGWFHFGFAAMYFAALIWHIKSAFEHWERVEHKP